MSSIFKYIWAELSVSENQSNWFDYAESHLAHMMLGVLSVLFVSCIHLFVFSEFPYKVHMTVGVGLFWALYELITQRTKDIWGNLEDWLFLFAYSALPCILLFTEIEGTSFLSVNMSAFGPICAIIAAHMLTGISVRIYKALK